MYLTTLYLSQLSNKEVRYSALLVRQSAFAVRHEAIYIIFNKILRPLINKETVKTNKQVYY